MAPPGPRDDADAPDPAEDLDESSTDESPDGYGADADEQDLPLDAVAFEDDTDQDGDFADTGVRESATADEGPAELTPLLADDEELAEVVAAVDDDAGADADADADEDALKEGEFICRSCFMAKRDSALADEDAMLCRDCV